jgi:ssDNA-binding replication factor A large subunit
LPILKFAQISGNMRNIEVTGKIVRKEDTREVKTRYGLAKVSWAILRDENASIRLNLWRQQIDEVQVGDAVRLINTFAKVYRDEMELNKGSDGRIDVLERGSLWK